MSPTAEQFEEGRDLLGRMVKACEQHPGAGVIARAGEVQAIAQAFKYLADGRDEARRDVDALKADLVDVKNQHSKLAAAASSATKERDAARAEVSQLIAQRDALNAKLEALRGDMGTAQRVAKTFREERNEARAQTLRASEEARAFKAELEWARRHHASWVCDAAAAQGQLIEQLVASQVEVNQLRGCADKDRATIAGLLEQRDRACAVAKEACDQRDELAAKFEDLVEVLVDESAPSVVVLQLGERVFG